MTSTSCHDYAKCLVFLSADLSNHGNFGAHSCWRLSDGKIFNAWWVHSQKVNCHDKKLSILISQTITPCQSQGNFRGYISTSDQQINGRTDYRDQYPEFWTNQYQPIRPIWPIRKNHFKTVLFQLKCSRGSLSLTCSCLPFYVVIWLVKQQRQNLRKRSCPDTHIRECERIIFFKVWKAPKKERRGGKLSKLHTICNEENTRCFLDSKP